MITITVRNVNHALPVALALLRDNGIEVAPRGKPTLEIASPVTTVYQRPLERVLFSKLRNANPFFHLFESMWILAGRQDVEFLSFFNSRISQYSDDGEVFHAPYGHRLLNYRGVNQVNRAIAMLIKDPDSRRAVLCIWDPLRDLNAESSDIPCNDLIMLKLRDGLLHITVMCRSNDAIWGAYGTNVVQFSFLQEYIAAWLGVGMGTYTQISNSFHVYTDLPYWQQWLQLHPAGVAPPRDEYEDMTVTPYRLFKDPDRFTNSLRQFFHLWDKDKYSIPECGGDESFQQVLLPIYRAWFAYKMGVGFDVAQGHLANCYAEDWRLACSNWLQWKEYGRYANA